MPLAPVFSTAYKGTESVNAGITQPLLSVLTLLVRAGDVGQVVVVDEVVAADLGDLAVVVPEHLLASVIIT